MLIWMDSSSVDAKLLPYDLLAVVGIYLGKQPLSGITCKHFMK